MTPIVTVISFHVEQHERYLQGVLDYVRSREPDWELNLLLMRSSTPERSLQPRPEDGILVLGANKYDRKKIEAYDCRKVILYDYGRWDTTGLGLDHEALGRQAAQHLKERGYQSFLYFEAGDDPNSQIRGDGFCSELPEVTRFLQGARSTAKGHWELADQLNDLADLLHSLPKPVGVFCPDAVHGERAIQAARIMNYSIPSDIGIVVVDADFSFCEIVRPSLTQISWIPQKLGWQAADLMTEIMNGSCSPGTQRRVQPEEIIVRESSSYWGGSSPLLGDLHHVLQQDWSICRDYECIAGRLNTSRRSLDRHCMQAYGMTLGAHIERLRVERTLTLLRRSQKNLALIAEEVGYSAPGHLSTAVKRVTGKTPSQIRKALNDRSC